MRTVDRKALAEKIFEEISEWIGEAPFPFEMDDEEIWEKAFEKVQSMEDDAGDAILEERRERKWEEEN